MEEQDRISLINLELEKAHKFLSQADEMLNMSYWDLAANRYYYACFHAVQALFVHDGISSHTHNGLLTLFGLHYIKTGKIDAAAGTFLSTMEQIRKKGDYNCKVEVKEQEVKEMSVPSKKLIETIELLTKT